MSSYPVARSLALFKMNLAKQRAHGINSSPAAPPVVFDSKVVKSPPHIHHAVVEAVDGPRFNQNQRRVRSDEKWRVFIQLQISATYVF